MAEPEPDSEAISLRQGIGYAWRTLKLAFAASPGLILWASALTLAVALLPAAALYMSKLVVDGVVAAIESGAVEDRNQALIWVGVETGILALLLALRRLLTFEKSRLHAEVGFAASSAILERAEALSLEEIERAETQQQLVITKQFATSRPYSLINRMFDGGQQAVTLISVAALLWSFSPLLLLFMLGGALPLFLGNLRFSDTAYNFYKGRTPQVRERSYLEGLISAEGNAKERLHYRFGAKIMARYRALFRELYQDDVALKGRQALWGAALAIVSSAVFLGAKLWIVWVTIAGAITLGQMTMFVGLVKQGQANITNLLSAFNGVVEDVLYVSNLFALLDRPIQPVGQGASAGPDPSDGLRFEAVSFTYPLADRPALDAVSFHLPPGTSLGIVGVNGAGKSTLVKLALGLYRPQAGRVTLDGLDLVDWDRGALTRRFGVLFQPSTNFKLTARENIAAGIGFAELSDEAAHRAAEKGLATDVLEALPHGLETRLSKRFLDGFELSGGQWKRLGLARAYANEAADMLILDEPTAALDVKAEAALMAQPREGKSLILISHRLSNLRPADKILVLDGGRLVEEGRHDALVEAGGAYAEMFKLQADAYL